MANKTPCDLAQMTTPATSHAPPSPFHSPIILYLFIYVFSNPKHALLFYKSVPLNSILECPCSLLYLAIAYPFFQNKFKYFLLPFLTSEATTSPWACLYITIPVLYRHYYFVNQYPFLSFWFTYFIIIVFSPNPWPFCFYIHSLGNFTKSWIRGPCRHWSI